MTNRHLSDDERASLALPLIAEVRERLLNLAAGDFELHWALRRKLAKELIYDERLKPMQRRALKEKKRHEQSNRCAVCSNELPEKNVVLDRFEAMKGYTIENTRLLCRDCDYKIQEQRRFA